MANDGELLRESFPAGTYEDVDGLCAEATIERIGEQGWSLNPGRYVGGHAAIEDGVDFISELARLTSEFARLSGRALSLTELVEESTSRILQGGH